MNYESSSELEFESDDQENDSDVDSDEKNIYLDDELYDKPTKKQKLNNIDDKMPTKKEKR